MVSAEQIGQASGLSVGDSFFMFNEQDIINRIKQLQTIEEVAISKKFPGYVKVEVTEFKRVAFQINGEGQQEALLADGSTVPLNGLTVPLDKPILTGWDEDSPLKAELCAVLGSISEPLLSDISEIVPDPSQAYEDKIRIYTKSQFEVSTRIALLDAKLQYLDVLIQEIKDQDLHAGVFTLMEQDRFVPVESEPDSDEKEGSE